MEKKGNKKIRGVTIDCPNHGLQRCNRLENGIGCEKCFPRGEKIPVNKYLRVK